MIAALSLLLTVLAFTAARALAVRVPSPWTNPVGVSVVALILLVRFGPIDLPSYQVGTAPLLWLLRPAVVALGWLVYQQRDALGRWAAPLAAGVAAGTASSLALTPLLAGLFGADETLQRALALKSVTSAVGVDLAGRLGAEAALAVPLIILAGILGAAFGAPLLHRLGLRDPALVGIAVGTNSHGIGTAGMAKEGPQAVATAGLAMGASAVATALLAPLAWGLLGWDLPS